MRVLRAVCAVDCGRMINPEIVKQQIEGGMIYGISAATGEPLEIVNGIADGAIDRRLSACRSCATRPKSASN